MGKNDYSTYVLYAPSEMSISYSDEIISEEKDIEYENMSTYYVLVSSENYDSFEDWCSENYFEYDKC